MASGLPHLDEIQSIQSVENIQSIPAVSNQPSLPSYFNQFRQWVIEKAQSQSINVPQERLDKVKIQVIPKPSVEHLF